LKFLNIQILPHRHNVKISGVIIANNKHQIQAILSSSSYLVKALNFSSRYSTKDSILSSHTDIVLLILIIEVIKNMIDFDVTALNNTIMKVRKYTMSLNTLRKT
jgi:hypothetical protein